MGTTELARAVRRSLTLVAGTFFGLLAGFAFALVKPRVPAPRPDPPDRPESGQQ